MEAVTFADCVLFTDSQQCDLGNGIRTVPSERFNSSREYSEFMIRKLADHIRTPHCLVVQWDGFVIDADRWNPQFLQFDFIGAPWPQFDDGLDVGNGGFSLRSQRLLKACQDSRFRLEGPEDVAICRVNRGLLEAEHGIRFAGPEMAEQFSFERTSPSHPTFGFHGVFNMADVIGPDAFWDVYSGLDDPTTVFVDYWRILRQLGVGREPTQRRTRLTCDRLAALLRG